MCDPHRIVRYLVRFLTNITKCQQILLTGTCGDTHVNACYRCMIYSER
jgi:hypothetical protein